MNANNLIPNSQRSREQLQEMGRKGGIASGKVRRKNRELRKVARWLLKDVDLSYLAEFVQGGAGRDK